MLTSGHIAASYILAQSVKSIGIPLTFNEVFGIIIAGNIIDLDFFIGFITGKTGEAHHHSITHTPIGILVIWLGIWLIFKPPSMLSFLILAALFIHLILDDIGHWTYRAHLFTSRVYPQINWFYPFTKYHHYELIMSNIQVLKHYVFKTTPIFILEVVLVIIAGGLFLVSK